MYKQSILAAAVFFTVFPALLGQSADSVTDFGSSQAKEVSKVTVFLNDTKSYSPMIFGGFLEHFNRQIYGGVYEPQSPLSNEKGFRLDVIEALKELKVPVVRWPGGCFVSGYHWKAGIGPNRIPVDDMAWGVRESNAFGTDEFVELCRLAGWQPYICNNAGNGTIDEMVEWVEYCNTPETGAAYLRIANGHLAPFNVKLWSIGNENYGPWEIGHKTADQWAPMVREAAQRMKAVDAGIKLAAAAVASDEWVGRLLEAAGQYLDYISIHGYWLICNEKNQQPDYLTCVMYSNGPENQIVQTIQLLEKYGYRGRIKIAFDEWNLRGWHHPGFPRREVSNYNDPHIIELVRARDKNLIPSQYTMADALFSASFFNACLRHSEDVGMANIAPLVNTRGPLYVYPGGIVKRTTFHTMAMYANLLGSRVAKTEVQAGPLAGGGQSIPVLDAIGTVNEAQSVCTVALVNRHPLQEVICTIDFRGAPLPSGWLEAVVLAGDMPEAYNDIEHPHRVSPEKKQLLLDNGSVKLSPHSLTILKIPLK